MNVFKSILSRVRLFLSPLSLVKSLSVNAKLALCVLVLLHLSFVASTSNRASGPEHRGNEIFGLWREFAWDTQEGLMARGTDFYATYEAGHQAIVGRSIYAVRPEMASLPRDETRMRAPVAAVYRYVPLNAYTIGAALNVLPPQKSYKAWVLFNELLVLFNIILCLHLVKSPSRVFGTIAMWLAFYPLHIEFYLGQFSFFMGCVLLWCGVCLYSKREKAAQILWGVSLFIKTYSILFALYWLFRKNDKQWKIPIVCLLILAVTTFGYFAFFPSDFTETVMFNLKPLIGGQELVLQSEGEGGAEDSPSRQAPVVYWGSMGVQRGILAVCRLINPQYIPREDPRPPYWSTYLLQIPTLLLFIVMLVAIRKKTAPVLSVFGLYWVFWFFAFLDTWENHYTMILPLIALLFATGETGKRETIVWYIFIALPSLFIIFKKNAYFSEYDKGVFLSLSAVYFLIKPIGVIGLTVSLCRNVLKKHVPTKT